MNIGRIYKIENDENDLIYIGSTTQKLTRRYSEHKCKNKNPIMNYKNTVIHLIEQFRFNEITELKKREQFYLNKHNNKINQIKAYESKDEKRKRMREWRNLNRDRINNSRRLAKSFKKIQTEFLNILL